MATRIIQITGFTDGNPVEPIMTSKGNITCSPGDTIKWLCPPAIGYITSVYKTGGTQVFRLGPAPIIPAIKEHGWYGVIKDAKNLPDPVDEESYSISGAPKGTTPVPYDPQITVNR